MIEILYEDICNLYGDYGNIDFLKKNFDNVICTNINDKPYFIDHDVDLVYMGSTSNNYIKLIIDKLKEYKKEIKNKIENNTYFLFTGNAVSILSKQIMGDEDIKGLGILNLTVSIDYKKRLNCHYKGFYKDIPILGFKSQFELLDSEEPKFMNTELGFGNDLSTLNEGIHYKNLYATSVLGPFLILNPLFTKELFKNIGKEKIKYYNELMDAYEFRLEEYDELLKIN